MAFTLSHAAAALPFRHTVLDLSALMAGCFAPDFEYFLRFGPVGDFGHTLPGLILADLPLAFLLLWLFHRFVKEPLAVSLPGPFRRRLELGPRSLALHSFSRLRTIVVSILVGEATHMVWDWFCHQRYWPYRHWSFLRRTAELPVVGARPYCDILEYLSSALGLLVLLLWAIDWYRSSQPIHSDFGQGQRFQTRISLVCLFAASILAGLVRARASGFPHAVRGSQRFMTQSVVTAITLFSVGIILYGWVRSPFERRAEPDS